MSISCWNGTISSDDFRRSAYAFSEKWRILDHELNYMIWHWIEPTKQPWMVSDSMEGYLSLERVCFPGSHQKHIGGANDFLQKHIGGANSISLKEPNLTVEDIDNCTLAESSDPELYFDLHILHSSSFMVPVLYFRAYFSDGEPLLLEAFDKHLPRKSAELISNSKWTFVTSEEHPYLRRPWHMLHPCGTADWMRLLLTDEPHHQYLFSWFTLVSQLLGFIVNIHSNCFTFIN